MDQIAVLIPCYNECKTIEKVISDFKSVLPEASIYVYDNNSTDGTDVLAERAGAIVRHEYQQGKGNVIRRMFREIHAQCYIIIDGDDTYPPDSAREMSNLILNKKIDMVIGDRLSSTYFTENKRAFHNFGNYIVRQSVNSMFNANLNDIMTGFRAFSYDFVKTFPVLSRGFEIETEMSIHAIDKNLSVQNVVIQYRDRQVGSESKLNTFTDGFKVLRTIFRLFKNYHPQQFFNILSLLLFILATVFFIPILIEYIQTGLVPQLPTLIVCGFVVLTSIQSFFAGLLLQTITQKNKQDFEMSLHQAHLNYESEILKLKNKTK